MHGSLTDFALQLARDPEALARFRSSPEAASNAMNGANLSDRARRAMESADHRQIADALAADARVALAEVVEEPAPEVVEEPTPEIMEAPSTEHVEAPTPEMMEAQ